MPSATPYGGLLTRWRDEEVCHPFPHKPCLCLHVAVGLKRPDAVVANPQSIDAMHTKLVVYDRADGGSATPVAVPTSSSALHLVANRCRVYKSKRGKRQTQVSEYILVRI
jgi:hypothetical protein